jgi:succinoglycan biosynthesis transport protein ExoP
MLGATGMSASDRFERAREADTGSAMLGILRRRWLVAVTVLCTCVAVAVIHQQKTAKTYKATASVAFHSGTLSDAALQVSTSGGSEPQREADTEVLIAHSPEVARAVRQQLQLAKSVEKLLSDVQVEAAPNANVLDIVAATGDPQESAQLANAFASQYIAFRTKSELEGINTAAAKLQHEIASLPAGAPERTTLEQSLQRLSGLRAVAGGGANIIGSATPPSTPAGKKLSTTILLGLIAGIALAISIALLIEVFDRRIKTLEECEREYRLSTLTSVPQSAFRANRPETREEALEAYRILRGELDFAAVTRQLDTLLVTSAISGEGKTTVAVELARVIALAERRVILMEMDLRRPAFREHFDVDPAGGLTAALTDRAPLAQLLEEPIADLPQLSVLPAGRLPHNPSEMLSSPRIAEIISELAAQADMVIIDAPPLNPVADTQVLLNNPSVHTTLVVARVNHLKRDEARRAKGILARHMIEPVGLVVTGLGDLRMYGYGAYGGYTSSPQDARVVAPTQGLSRSSAKRELPL